MRTLIGIPLLVIAIVFSSCAETTVGDVRVHSSFGTPSKDEIRAVIAANPTDKKIYEIQVLSPSEMRVYYSAIHESVAYFVVQRVNGKWRYVPKIFFVAHET